MLTGIGTSATDLTERPGVWVGQVLPPRLPMKLSCLVEPNRVAAEVNGRPIHAWQGDVKTLNPVPKQRNNPLSVYASQNVEFAFDEIVLEPLGPDPGRPHTPKE